MQLKDIKQLYIKQLNQIHSNNEIAVLVEMVFEKVLSLSRTQVLINQNLEIKQAYLDTINSILNRLKTNEPIQYIFGTTDFYNLNFKLDSSTLIPRQETEELVHLIIKNNKTNSPKILDIGTGSGCIAISIHKNIAFAESFAIDISAKALEIARINASTNECNVSFQQFDILNWENKNLFSGQKFDIIVSNPPYIRESEKELMQKNVLDYEPSNALFVDNKEALIFYQKITKFAKQHLNSNGFLYFEINEAFGPETAQILHKESFTEVRIIKDLNGKDRIVCGQAK